jgi:hypothetical protein
VGIEVVTFDEEPTALTLDSLDNLVVLLREPQGWGLVRYAGHGGERFASGSSYPASIASGYTNNTYMATFGQNQIGQVTPTGAVNYAWGLIPMTHPQGWDALGPNPLTWYPDAAAVAEAPDGSVYVSTSYALWHFSEQGTLIRDWLVADKAGHPLSVTSLAAAPEGDVIVTTKAGLARLKFPSTSS